MVYRIVESIILPSPLHLHDTTPREFIPTDPIYHSTCSKCPAGFASHAFTGFASHAFTPHPIDVPTLFIHLSPPSALLTLVPLAPSAPPGCTYMIPTEPVTVTFAVRIRWAGKGGGLRGGCGCGCGCSCGVYTELKTGQGDGSGIPWGD